jgi:uncharacterized YceG family protein
MASDPAVIRRRRAIALGAIVLVLVAVGVAIAAAPHVHRHHAVPPPPPPPHAYKVVFPEGFTSARMVARVGAVAKIATRERHGRPVRLKAAQYAAAAKHVVVPCFHPKRWATNEGFLFPSTYEFIFKTTGKQLVQTQLQAFCEVWRDLDLRYARKKNLTDYDVLKIASLVEGEAVLPGDRAKVAAVIYNRLHLGMTLAIDAALRYGLHIPGTQSIHESQLQNPTPYNLRLHTGLPPTPINNPGRASIEAAVHPAHADYLFFVAAPDHKHTFFTASGTAFNRYKCQHGYGC